MFGARVQDREEVRMRGQFLSADLAVSDFIAVEHIDSMTDGLSGLRLVLESG